MCSCGGWRHLASRASVNSRDAPSGGGLTGGRRVRGDARRRRAEMERGAEDKPEGEGDPFGLGEVAWEGGDDLRGPAAGGDQGAEGGEGGDAQSAFDEGERGAGVQ